MKALTVHQPYATMLAHSFEAKPCENRDETIAWRNYRGPIAIHAGVSSRYITKAELERYPTGVVVCKGHLIACFRYERACEALERGQIPKELGDLGWRPGHVRAILEHPETTGPLCLVITDRELVEPPIAARGKQGLWEWSEP